MGWRCLQRSSLLEECQTNSLTLKTSQTSVAVSFRRWGCRKLYGLLAACKGKHHREDEALPEKTGRSKRRCQVGKGWGYSQRQFLQQGREAPAPARTKSPYRVSFCGVCFVNRSISQYQHSCDELKRDTRTVSGIVLY